MSSNKKIVLRLEEMIRKNPYDYLDKMMNAPFYKFRVGTHRGIVTVVNNKLIIHVIKIHAAHKLTKNEFVMV